MLNLLKNTERKVEMNLIEKLIAGFVERAFKNYVTTIIGALVIVGATLGGLAGAISDNLSLYGVNVHTALVTAIAVLGGVACILAKDSGTKVPTQVGVLVFAVALMLVFPAQMRGQTAAPTPAPAPAASSGVAFTPASYAVYVDLASTSSVANLTTETLNITKTCGIEGAELLAPAVNLQGYYGGAACTPDLSKLFTKTLIPTNAFSFSFAGDGGWALNTTTNASTKNASAQFRGCVTYNLGSSGVIAPVCAGYLYAPGFGASPHGFIFSVGLGKVFGSL